MLPKLLCHSVISCCLTLNSTTFSVRYLYKVQLGVLAFGNGCEFPDNLALVYPLLHCIHLSLPVLVSCCSGSVFCYSVAIQFDRLCSQSFWIAHNSLRRHVTAFLSCKTVMSMASCILTSSLAADFKRLCGASCRRSLQLWMPLYSISICPAWVRSGDLKNPF